MDAFRRDEIPLPLKQLTVVHVVDSPTSDESSLSPSSHVKEVFVSYRDMHRWKQLLPLLRHVESHFARYNLEFTVKSIDRVLKALHNQARPLCVSSPKLSSPKEK